VAAGFPIFTDEWSYYCICEPGGGVRWQAVSSVNTLLFNRVFGSLIPNQWHLLIMGAAQGIWHLNFNSQFQVLGWLGIGLRAGRFLMLGQTNVWSRRGFQGHLASFGFLNGNAIFGPVAAPPDYVNGYRQPRHGETGHLAAAEQPVTLIRGLAGALGPMRATEPRRDTAMVRGSGSAFGPVSAHEAPDTTLVGPAFQ